VRWPEQRGAVLEAAQSLGPCGLSRGMSGNVSVRVEDGLLITPSGMPYAQLSPADMVELGMDGSAAAGQRQPSSEWRIHRDIYLRREDVGAVVHAHPMFSTTLSCLRRPLPAVHYMIAVTGSSRVRCAAYATFGTEALSLAALEALGASRACLLANHGLVAVGAHLQEALRVASEVEQVAEQYWRALQVGEPVILDEEEMTRVLEKFRTYGQPSPEERG
jgi:L-fuculose-phosphate aldolase